MKKQNILVPKHKTIQKDSPEDRIMGYDDTVLVLSKLKK